MINYALKYIKKGKSIIPVGQNKIPLIEWKEYQERIATEQEVRDWWAKYPNANIGLVTGKVSGVAVVDIERGGSTNGLPPTLCARTGGGGWHLYYKYAEGIENKTRIKDLMDIRGEGGYVVAPPSIHASGNSYEWINEDEMVDFPKDLFEIRKKNDWREIVSGVTQGNRNDTATKLLGKLMGIFHPTEWKSVVVPMLKSWNKENNPPLSDTELKSIYESIAKRAVNDEKHNDSYFIPFDQMLDNAVVELKNTRESDVVSLGYDWLDEKLTGLFKGELLIVGGETGTGKTTFATNIIYKASKKRKCAVFALEDRLTDYTIKALYFEIGRIKDGKNYPWNDYRKNVIKDKNFPEVLERAKTNLKNKNIYFADTDAKMTIETLEKIIEKKINEGFELFLLDHLHYFDLLRGNSTKADYIEQVMVRIKRLQVRTGARIIMVVHYKKLNGKKPSIDSFKDSISIVQNANYVINLWRDRSEGSDHYTTKFFVPKSRNPNGEGQIEVVFDPNKNDYKETGEWEFGTSIQSVEDELKAGINEAKLYED